LGGIAFSLFARLDLLLQELDEAAFPGQGLFQRCPSSLFAPCIPFFRVVRVSQRAVVVHQECDHQGTGRLVTPRFLRALAAAAASTGGGGVFVVVVLVNDVLVESTEGDWILRIKNFIFYFFNKIYIK
jgi:hypothetical protein